MHAAGCGGLGCAPGCSELATTASIQHKWHDTPGDTQEAPTLSYSGCYGSSWFAGNVPCTAHPRGCPASCASEAPSPLRAQRVRRGLSTLSDSEWARVVSALWLMKNTSTADGQARWGASYREYDFFAYKHLVAQFPPFDGTKCMDKNCWTGMSPWRMPWEPKRVMGIDATGGGPQQLTWHALWILEFETVLLLIDPQIGGLPYADWPNLVGLDEERYEALVGFPSCSQPHDCYGEPGFPQFQTGTLDTGPFAHWPLTTRFHLSEWLAANPGAAEAGWAEVLKPEHDLIRPTSTLSYFSEAHATLRGNTRDTTMALTSIEGLRQNVSDALAFCTEEVGCRGGSYLEVSSCYEAKLVEQTLDLHFLFHGSVLGGDGTGMDGAVHPLSWLHHAGGDWLRSTWQFNNPQLRGAAYGYPATSAYNQSRVDLYDVVNVDAYGLGFGRGLLDGASLGNMTAADVMCGLEELYTYDTIVEAYSERGGGVFDCSGDPLGSKGGRKRNRANRQRAIARAGQVSAIAFFVGTALLCWRRRRRSRRAPGELDAADWPQKPRHLDAQHMPSYMPYGYDLSENDAAIRAQRGSLDGLGVQSL